LSTAGDDLAIVRLTVKAFAEMEARETYVVRVLKGSPQTPAEPQGGAVCPSCGREATLLRTLGRYYCFNCKRYVT